MYNLIYKITELMKESKIGLKIYDFLDGIGLRGGVNRIAFWLHRSDLISEEEIEENSAYFKGKDVEIEQCCDLLNDEMSKKVLKQMIKFRCTGSYKDLPPNSFSKQYFGYDFFKYQEGESYVDCGGYDGDTIMRFKRLMRRKGIKKYSVVVFEPDSMANERLKKKFPDVTCIESGLWDKEGDMFIRNTGIGQSIVISESEGVAEANVTRIRVTALDSNDICRNATFIKMDIEGSEYKALLGAEHIIKENKPKLAICLYHSNEDMLRLIKLVHELNPQYKLYVRQHTNGVNETVLYAC